MIERTVSPEDLARLKAAREEADRRYNDALTALDAALVAPPDLPHPPPGPDEFQVTPLNETWAVVQHVPEPPPRRAGVIGRLADRLWQLVAPYALGHLRAAVEGQQAFNSRLVDHVNRNVAVGRATREAIASTIAYLGDQLRALVTFQSRLIVYLQQVTPYVDTKDYEFAGLSRRVDEDLRELIDILDHRTVGLAGAISGVGDELARRWESMVARERRYDEAVSRLAAAHDELRSAFAIVQQTHLTLKRELERRLVPAAPPAVPGEASSASPGASPTSTWAGSAETGSTPAGGGPAAGTPPPGGRAEARFQQMGASSVDAYKYVGFEGRFRGTPDEIRQRLTDYLPLFDGATDVLDLGCGRGEFLELLRERGIVARGVDLNREMVEQCRERGLDVEQGDGVAYLERLPDGALGGLFAAQVVEHLQPDDLLRLLDLAYYKLRPGSRVVLETINPACWLAFFSSYIRDLTHVRPVHPDTLAYYLQASGFQAVRIEYRMPVAERDRLQRAPGTSPLEDIFNANVDRLNGLLFTYLDYAAIGERR